jgi:hypothetical protein
MWRHIETWHQPESVSKKLEMAKENDIEKQSGIGSSADVKQWPAMRRGSAWRNRNGGVNGQRRRNGGENG